MSQFRTQIGPNIVYDNSLVFYYDMGNTETSFKGKPTTNLLDQVNNMNNVVWEKSGTLDIEDNFARPEQGLVVSSTGSSARYILNNSTVTAGTNYTQSVFLKPNGINYFQMAPSTGFGSSHVNYELIGEGAVGGPLASSASIKLIKSGRYQDWYRCTLSATCNSSTTTGRIVFALADSLSTNRLINISETAGEGVLMLDPQLEASSFATPFVNGTRSNTQAIVDIAGGKTITIYSLTYPDSNTFEFTSANEDFMQFPYTQSDPNNFTLEAWIYHTAHSSDTNIGHTIMQSYFNIDGWIFGLKGTDSRLNLRQHNISAQTSVDITYSTGLSLNTWYHVVAACNNTTDALYVNGEQVASQSHFTGTTGVGTTSIGAWGAGASTAGTNFAGKIPVVRVYERGLTASEVKRNFNAQRGRFGI